MKVSARILNLDRAMAILMNVGKASPDVRQHLHDRMGGDLSKKVAYGMMSPLLNLQDACLKLMVLARARARELQVDQQVERA